MVMFQNVNKHWRAHLERPMEETIQGNWVWSKIHRGSIRAPLGLHRGSIGGLLGVLWGSFRVHTEDHWVFLSMKLLCAFQMTSPNNLSNWALQCLFTFWNITILDCNSNYLALYSILFFDTNVYNES